MLNGDYYVAACAASATVRVTNADKSKEVDNEHSCPLPQKLRLRQFLGPIGGAWNKTGDTAVVPYGASPKRKPEGCASTACVIASGHGLNGQPGCIIPQAGDERKCRAVQ